MNTECPYGKFDETMLPTIGGPTPMPSPDPLSGEMKQEDPDIHLGTASTVGPPRARNPPKLGADGDASGLTLGNPSSPINAVNNCPSCLAAALEHHKDLYNNSYFDLFLNTFAQSHLFRSSAGPDYSDSNFFETHIKHNEVFPHRYQCTVLDAFPNDLQISHLENLDKMELSMRLSQRLVPSTQALTSQNGNLPLLIRSQGKIWLQSALVIANFPCPVPDYTLGFSPTMFTTEQLNELEDRLPGHVRPFEDTCFPFFTCQVVGRGDSLGLADRKNAWSMTVSMRALIRLLSTVGCLRNFNRRILAVSMSHDYTSIRLYGHYFECDSGNVQIWRVKVQDVDLIAACEGGIARTRFFIERCVCQNLAGELGQVLVRASEYLVKQKVSTNGHAMAR